MPDDAPWAQLEQALTHHRQRGRTLDVWWRDDDAVAATPHLDRLLALVQRHRIPLALAVVPAATDPSLPQRLAQEEAVRILQHGWAHKNHAPPSEKKSEYPADRDPAICLAELRRGQDLLRQMFGSSYLPVLVPPWNRLGNRLAAALIPQLPAQGFIGLSGGPSGFSVDAPDLTQIHTHLDPIDWPQVRQDPQPPSILRPLSKNLDPLIQRLSAAQDTPIPLGFLSHHLIHDDDCWIFWDRLFGLLRRYPNLRFLSPQTLFITANPRTNP